MVANAPSDQIYDFKGQFRTRTTDGFARKKTSVNTNNTNSMELGDKNEDLLSGDDGQVEALSLENTLWANTVLASSGYILGMITYTGIETRAQMNSKEPLTKVGKLDLEVNRLSKLLFIFMIIVSFIIVALGEFKGNWLINFFRFILLLSYIIPISLRVNLDLGKVFYCVGIYRDSQIPGTIPRNSTIPEELGRI